MTILSTIRSKISDGFNKVRSGISKAIEASQIVNNVKEGVGNGFSGGMFYGGMALLGLLPELAFFDIVLFLEAGSFVSLTSALTILGIVTGSIFSIPIVAGVAGAVGGLFYCVGKSLVDLFHSNHPKSDIEVQKERELSATKIQAAFRGHEQRKIHPLSKLLETRTNYVKAQYALALDKKADHTADNTHENKAQSLKYAIEHGMWHKAIQIIRNKPEQEMQSKEGLSFKY